MSATVSTGSAEPTAVGANDQDLSAGTEVGEYRIERVLGKGGFGVVYAAIQPVIGKQVAIKLLARKYSADQDIVSRFVAEARAVNQIRHRNIIDIFSFGSLSDGRHYYVMEYLEGDPLDVYLRNHGPLELDEAIPILRAIAKALDAAHAKGIAHRDLKPENIFLARDPDGAVFPKLLDFGIAKLLTPDDDVRHKTNTGVPIGTPYYMSPEQCRGKDVDHRTDIYSFGIVAYRLLTGTYPIDGDDYMELLYKQVNEDAPPASSRNETLPKSVDDAIAWMMRKDRAQRPPTVLEGVNALDPTAAVTPSIPSARRSSPTAPPAVIGLAKTSTPDALAATFTPEFERPELATSALSTKPTRSRGLWIALAAALLIAAGAGVFAFTRGGSSTKSPQPAAASPVAAPAPPPTTPQPQPEPSVPAPVAEQTKPAKPVEMPPTGEIKHRTKPVNTHNKPPSEDSSGTARVKMPMPDPEKTDDKHSTIPSSDIFK